MRDAAVATAPRAAMVTGLSLGLVAGAPGAAQTGLADLMRAAPAVPEITAHGDWQLVCDPACRAEPRAPSPAGTMVAVVQDGAAQVLVLRGPLGLLLGEGVEVSVDGRTLGRLAFLTCEADGCTAPVTLDGAVRQALRAGNALRLVLRRRDGTAIEIDHSLIGFIAVTGALADSAP